MRVRAQIDVAKAASRLAARLPSPVPVPGPAAERLAEALLAARFGRDVDGWWVGEASEILEFGQAVMWVEGPLDGGLLAPTGVAR